MLHYYKLVLFNASMEMEKIKTLDLAFQNFYLKTIFCFFYFKIFLVTFSSLLIFFIIFNPFKKNCLFLFSHLFVLLKNSLKYKIN